MASSVITTEETTAEAEARRAPRTNLLLAATMDAGRMNAPVRIRNLSSSGALLEGASFPDVGGTLILRRLDLQIGATVVWNAGGRCGVKFDGTTCVSEWISGRSTAGQVQVDSIQAAIRAGSTTAPPRTRPSGDLADLAGSLDARLAEELAYVRRLLECIGDELSDEPAVVQRHARAFQNVDIASQLIGHIAAVLTSDDKIAAVNAIGMDELRARLLRKRIF